PKSFTGGQDNYPLTTPFGSPSTGAVMINSHSNGQLVSGTILVEAAVTGIGINGVNFYVDGVLMGYDGTNNYQFILNTNTLAEDVPFAITAEAILLYSPNINTTVTLIPNNLLNAGNYISVSTPEPEYSPDEDVAVLIDIINAPPTFDNLGIVLSYDEPTGYTQYTSTYNLPVDDMYQITMSLPSDAALGTYDVTAMAYGYVGEVLVWTANDTTQFDVVGQSVQDQLGDLNQTVGDMNNTLIDMNNTFNDFNSTFNDINSTFQNMNQTFEDIWNSFVNMEGNISSILENITRMRADLVLMNNTLFDIVNDIAGMNSSLSGLVNDLSSQLNAVNTSLHTSLTNLENNFLVELAGVNATLALDIQNLLASVTDDLAGMNITLGGRLTMLEGNLSGNISDLSNWLDLMLHEMDANLTATNMTLHQHMADLEAMTTEFYNNLTADLLDVMGRFFAMETNLTLQHNALINSIALLSDAVDAQHNLTRTQILDRVNQTYALLDSVDGNLTTHDSDIQALLAALDALVQNQGNMTRDQLVANTTQILADVATVQSNITSHDTAIRQNMTTLSNLMVTLDQQSLAIVNYIVSELAQNLSAHDTGISDDLLGITDDISGFRDLTDEQLQVINTTLENLVKLDGIITDLEELDLALQAAETQLSDDIGTTSNSEISKIDLGTMLLAVLIILAIISILIGLMNRRTNVSTPAAGNDEADFEKDGSEGVEESEENPEIEESI
ncbi:MAG: hypothetical protein KKD98_08130, partial [Candidatus Thermoplasmatota archaeon]|nr:hypothetical protein [Candidatus Thermoplasmatota archaeon]